MSIKLSWVANKTCVIIIMYDSPLIMSSDARQRFHMSFQGEANVADMDFSVDQFTPEKLAEVQVVFSQFDRDQDGFVELKYLAGMMRSIGYNPTDAEIFDLKSNHEGRMPARSRFLHLLSFALFRCSVYIFPAL